MFILSQLVNHFKYVKMSFIKTYFNVNSIARLSLKLFFNNFKIKNLDIKIKMGCASSTQLKNKKMWYLLIIFLK